MPTTERTPGSDRTTVYQTGLHWIVLVPPAIAGAALIGLGIALMRRPTGGIHAIATPVIDSGWFGILIIVAGVLAIGFGILRVESTRLILTNSRVTIESGVVAHRSIEILLRQLESIQIDQSMAGQILGFGTVTMHGSGGTPEVMQMISNPEEFQRRVEEQTGSDQSEGATG